MKIVTFFALIFVIALPILALADANVPNLDEDPPGTITSATGVFTAISKITNWIFSLFLVLAVIFILYGAFKLLISGGNAEGLGEAKKLILYAAIAVVIAVLAKSIIVVAAKIVGVDITI